ncbi:MAG: CoA pyrophosphatase [Micromonosporaceae bacterium]|nr:CoA pyrophosphatase [Micromonosporaceae bacterium]
MTGDLPGWWWPLLDRVPQLRSADLGRHATVPPGGGRGSAVLVLLGEASPGEPDVVLVQRAPDMRNHAGQPAFPGGATDPGDADAAATALREAGEEIGLDPAGVRVVTALPPVWIAVSRFVVTPVLAWWRESHPIRPQDPAEVARVERVPVAELADPQNRLRVRHPSGMVGPAFRVRHMLVWGFTAGILNALLDLAGWSRPWRTGAEPVDLPIAGDQPVP